eukprot:COSAG03_NODE_8_length_24035_cov_36.331885_9_plen_80_part_00
MRQQRTFTKQLEGVGKNRWKSALHAASESATRTVRAENCTGLVTFGPVVTPTPLALKASGVGVTTGRVRGEGEGRCGGG